METIIVYPKNKEQLTAFKAIAKAMQIDFKVNKSPYESEFVAKIKRGEKAAKEGKGVKVEVIKKWWEE